MQTGISLKDKNGSRPSVVAAEQSAQSHRITNRGVSLKRCNGGAERDRTADPLLAKQVLSQLSYSPNL